MTDFKIGDRVRVSNSHEYRGKVGTVVNSGPYEFDGEVTLCLDFDPCQSYYFRPVNLEPEQRVCGPLCGETTCFECNTTEQVMPVDSAARKDVPITSGVFDYFPAALAEIARVSKAGNDKHNPGEPLHWARGKSMDQADAIGRHLIDRGGIDPDTGMRHSAELAWRALAMLQLELEEAGAPLARGASA